MVNKPIVNRVTPRQSAIMNILHKENGLSIRQIHVKFPQFSLSSVFRHATRVTGQCPVKVKRKTGRPRKVTEREERELVRVLKKLRETDGSLTSKKVQVEAGLTHISNRTVRAILNKHGFRYLQSRRKGLLTVKDLKHRLQFARRMDKNYIEDVWSRQICFFLDGSSFVHKTNPSDQARAPASKVWRRPNEGLKKSCTSKGKKAGSGGKVAHFIMCISYGKGVYFCERYEKMDGPFFSGFIKRNFRKLIRNSCNPMGKMFVQDGDPSQNSAAARRQLEKIGVQVHSIPARSPDLNPIENVFHLLNKELQNGAVAQNITHENFEQFCRRVKSIAQSIPSETIDKINGSMPKSIRQVISARGGRLQY